MLLFCYLQKQPPEAFCKKGALRNFTTFTGKHLCQRLPQGCNFIKKETLTQVFSCQFCEISKNAFLLRTPLVAVSVSSFLLHTKIQMESPELPCKKDVLRNFAKFTGKHLCQRLFFNKVAGLRSATLLKKRLWHKCFPVNFVTFLSTPFLQNLFGRIFLKLSKSINFTKFLSKTVIHFTGIPQDFTWKITRDHFRENIS